jgi:hypothetical protein
MRGEHPLSSGSAYIGELLLLPLLKKVTFFTHDAAMVDRRCSAAAFPVVSVLRSFCFAFHSSQALRP